MTPKKLITALENKRKILAVDDSPTQLEMLRGLLERDGYSVTVARDGMEALSRIETSPPDLIISDIVMPGMSGFDLCQRVKNDAQLSSIPVMLLTGLSDSQDIIQALDCGADNFVTKPFNENYLLSRVQHLLASVLLRTGSRLEIGVQLVFANKRHLITAEREQILDLLLSTYEAATIRNSELLQASEELQVMNERLEELVQARTKELEEKNDVLRTSETRYRALADTAPSAIVTANVSGTIVGWNRAAERMFGYSSAEAVGRPLTFMMPDRYHAGHLAGFNRRQGENDWHGTQKNIEAHGLTKEGREFPVALSFSAWDAPEGRFFTGFIRDITERRQLEWQISFRSAALEAAANAIIITDRDGSIEWVNPAFTTLTGYAFSEVIGGNPRDFLKSGLQDEEFFGNLWQTILAGRVWHGDIVNRRKDGSHYTENMTITPMLDETGQVRHFVGVKEDITERKKAEDAVRNAEARYRLLFEESPHGIALLNPITGRVVEANARAHQQLGYSREEFFALRVSDYEVIESEEETAAHVRKILIGGHDDFVTQHRTKSGEIRDVHVWASAFEADSKALMIYAIFQDITERKRMERQFLRTQRMESIGTLASGIAHDLNNVLTPIMMAAELLKMDITGKENLELLDTIASNTTRGAEMVKQVLSFGRGVEGRRVEVRARNLIGEIEQIVRDSFPKNIQMRTVLSSDLWALVGDPTQLYQVLLNLCVNARDAMPDGGVVTIRAENLDLDAGYVAANIDAKEGPYVVIKVEDTGTGISDEIIERIFDPFFTTKDVGAGTGLGLSTSLTIVKSHGGFLRVYSEYGKGTQFRIYLPAGVEQRVERPEGARPPLARGNGETVLLIDDEPPIRQMACRALEAFGYKVILAADGIEGLGLYLEHRNTIDVVITDMMMPKMDGAATIRALIQEDPDLRIIAVSGIEAIGEEARAAAPRAVKQVLGKPYTQGALLTAVRRALTDQH